MPGNSAVRIVDAASASAGVAPASLTRCASSSCSDAPGATKGAPVSVPERTKNAAAQHRRHVALFAGTSSTQRCLREGAEASNRLLPPPGCGVPQNV